MAVERNAPCPCGSGKKYKKCCLAQDEAARQAERNKPLAIALTPSLRPALEPTSEPPPAPKPVDPYMEAWNARWDEFDAADYEERLALFARTIEEEELMDAEMVSEMTSKLVDQINEHNDRDRFDALLLQLRERLPEVYEEEAHWLIGYQIKNALALGRLDKVAALVEEITPFIPHELSVWRALEEELAYHGQLEALLTATRAAWLEISQSRDLMMWGMKDFAERGTQYELLWQLEQSDRADRADGARADDPALLERLRFFFDKSLDHQRITETLDWLSGRVTRTWTMADFAFVSPTQSKKGKRGEAHEQAHKNLDLLLWQFMRYLHEAAGAPWVKTELARGKMLDYLIQRQEQKLEQQESLFGLIVFSGEPIKPFAPVTHPLCPDAERLDRYFAKALGFLSLRRFASFAHLEFTPHWVRFLVAQELLTQTEAEAALNSLKTVAENMLPFLRNEIDPALVLRHWAE